MFENAQNIQQSLEETVQQLENTVEMLNNRLQGVLNDLGEDQAQMRRRLNRLESR